MVFSTGAAGEMIFKSPESPLETTIFADSVSSAKLARTTGNLNRSGCVNPSWSKMHNCFG
eukprot:794200-Heterocapsa_arctica.AAC.1